MISNPKSNANWIMAHRVAELRVHTFNPSRKARGHGHLGAGTGGRGAGGGGGASSEEGAARQEEEEEECGGRKWEERGVIDSAG